MTEQVIESITGEKAERVLLSLVAATEGPKEAYGILCLAIYKLNFELADNPVSLDELADDVATSLRSIRKHGTQ